jgi:hypothetical protein
MKKNIKPIVIALGSSVVIGASALAVAGEARDMQGNKVMINDETGFTYGGDGMAKYSDGKLATGKKDPAVCGSFGGSSCSMAHLKK